MGEKKQSLANKYRPRTFSDVSEQESVRKILENQIATNNLKNVYLFCGGAGTGKTTTARIVANMITNGQTKPIELDCASKNGVDDMRMLQKDCMTRPILGKYKTFILDECTTGDTEILTNKGFIRFDKLDKTEKIAQYNDDGTIQFVEPIRYIEHDYEGPMYRFYVRRNRSVLFTPNHVQPLYINHSREIKENYIKDCKFTQAKSVLVGGKLDNNGDNELTDFERLIIANQADGSLYYDKNPEFNTWCMHLKRPEKIKRLEYLLKSTNTYYKMTSKGENGDIKCTYRLPKNITKNLHNHFNYNITYNKANEILNEVLLWDGSKKAGQNLYGYYSSIVKENVDYISSLATLCGYGANQGYVKPRKETHSPLYCVSWRKTNKRPAGRCHTEIEEYKGKVYCVEVPSHKIIIRAQGFTFVTGNCHMLTTQAWNSMLKIFEEPPPFDIFILCLTGDGLVQTPNGMVKLKSIKPGDLVWSGEKYVKVTNFFNNGIRDLLQIRLNDGRIIKCTPNHKLYVLRNGEEQWIEAKDITYTDNICVYHSYGNTTRANISDTMCKFLGYMVGNGCWYNTKMNFYTPPHKLNQVHEILDKGISEGWLRGYKDTLRKTGNCFDTQIYFKTGYRQEWNSLVGLRIAGRGQKQLPDIVYTFNKDQLLHFMNGWFLADGSSINHTFLPGEHTGQITCNYTQLIYDIQNICTSVGIPLNVYYREFTKMCLPDGRVKYGQFHTATMQCIKQKGYFKDEVLRRYFKDRAYISHSQHNKNYTIMFNKNRRITQNMINESQLESLKGDKWFTGIKDIKEIGKDIVYDIEVPETGYFIYNGVKVHNCTTDPQKILPTIMSRVQRFNFSKISVPGITKRLKYILEQEQILDYEQSAVEYIARISKGGMRDAITSLEKCLDYDKHLTLQNVMTVMSGGVTEQIQLQLLQHILSRNCQGALNLYNEIYLSGIDMNLFLKLYIEFLQNCTKYLITRNSSIVTISDLTIGWLDNCINQNTNPLEQIKNQLVDTLNIKSSYSSEDTKILLESWIIQICC